VNVEVALVAIEQRQGIAGAIEFQKFEFVGCRGEVAARRGVVDISPFSLAWLRLQVRGALDTAPQPDVEPPRPIPVGRRLDPARQVPAPQPGSVVAARVPGGVGWR
jgi:hypothetical protein